MTDHQLGMELHQKSFKGEQLTEQEETQLKAWYAQEDEMEINLLKVRVSEKGIIEQLRQQINDGLNRLAKLTQNIQVIALENDKIRKENTQLFQLLRKKSDSQGK